MKKAIISLIFTLFSLQSIGQDTILLNRILVAGKGVSSIEADLFNRKVKKGETTTQNGTFHFVSPYELSAVFTTGSYLIINEKKLKLDIGILFGKHHLREGGFARSLSNIFLFAFQGRCIDFANESGYILSMSSDKDYHTVTFTSKKRHILGIGYKKVAFKISTIDLLTKEIILTDYKGTIDTYTISNEKYNVPIDKNRFQF